MTTRISKPPQSGRPGMQLVLRPKDLVDGLNPEYAVSRFPATIGRHPTNDVELPFEAISRYHARIELNDGQPRIVDLRSSNGTWVNGSRVQMAALQDQDSISFGSLEFSVIYQQSRQVGGELGGEDRTPTSVHFLQQDSNPKTVYHTEIPEDSSHTPSLDEEITSEAQLRKARQRLRMLYRLQDVLRTSTEEEKLLRRVLDLMFEIVPVDRGVILVRDDHDHALFRPVVIKTQPKHRNEKIGISRTILQRCLRERLAILTRDAMDDERFNESESVLAGKMCSVMCVPMISMRNVLGFIHLDTTDAVRSFSEEDLAFIASMSAEVAMHLHNLRMLNEKIQTERMAAIGQTITGMAHNIKNILVLTQGGIEMMERRLKKKQYDTVEETWHVVRRGLDRINKTVQEMLDYSRARTAVKSKVDLNLMLQDYCQAFYDEMHQRGINCMLDLEPELKPMMLDADALDKALTNLIINAVEAVPEQTGRIILRTRISEEGSQEVEIEDNGEGIPAEILPRIFIPFFSTKGSKGSGLGLAMTRKCVEELGGRIAVRSRPGEGTCFTISFPLRNGAPKLSEG